ncbi:MAG TPA: prepilin-type N-terminal cleavage/methylation domain-containing protein [Lachnospiraceae bacterium]|nr:prepilin-type N-terminal cleavage/methylation domain-containing protein [Lachnospiraceae bacterium]
MKKTNNKGFSLVELIIVIAIMAVLMTVLAPQFLKYVEKSRLQKDNSAIGEIESAINVALADEKISDSITASYPITFSGTSGVKKHITFSTDGTKLLEEELADVLGSTITLSSKTYTKETYGPIITVTVSGNGFSVSKTNIIE